MTAPFFSVKHLFFFGLIVTAGCSRRGTLPPVDQEEPTYQCEYMESVCAESDAFEKKFAGMSGEEKKEAESIRDTYRRQCADAAEACRRSQANR